MEQKQGSSTKWKVTNCKPVQREKGAEKRKKQEKEEEKEKKGERRKGKRKKEGGKKANKTEGLQGLSFIFFALQLDVESCPGLLP